MNDEYRKRIYTQYASIMQNAHQDFDLKAARVWGRPYRRYLHGWLPSAPGAAVLEVGCGSGRMLQLLKDAGYENLQGIDISPEQVQLSRQVLPAERIHEGDAISYLETQVQAFDLILGLDIVEHLTKAEVLRFLDAAAAALRPGGRLVLQTPNAESPWGAEYRYGDFTHELVFTPNALLRLMTLCGFSGAEAREMGPVVHGVRSGIRLILWRAIRLLLLGWNYIEMGNRGSGILTRIMLVSCWKD